MNIEDKSALRECTSCQLCAAVCPKGAISISLDVDGFYRPFVDYKKCVDCGFCTKFCYKFDKQILDFGQDKLNDTILYGASAKDRDIVMNTTSGGIADVLARQLISEGYKCVGVVYDSKSNLAVDRIATTYDEIVSFRGSKYIQSYTVRAFKEVIDTCKKDKYAVFGTPCHIYALDRYLRQHRLRNNVFLIDLCCHGCPSMLIWKKYIAEIKERENLPTFDFVNFRSKTNGWGNYYLLELQKNGKAIYNSENGHNEFYDLFFSDLLLNDACNNCRLRSTLAYTDIRLGDFWGKQYVLDKEGISAVCLVSENAKLLFSNIENKINFRKEKFEDFLPWQSWGVQNHPNENLRQKLLEQLGNAKLSLQDSIQTIYQNQSTKSKIIRYFKKIVHSWPLSCEKRIRWIYYHLKF